MQPHARTRHRPLADPRRAARALGAAAAHRPHPRAVPAAAVEDAHRAGANDGANTRRSSAASRSTRSRSRDADRLRRRHPARRAGRRHRALRSLLLPVFSSLYAVPIVILYPVFTAWFGIGSESKIAFAGVYGFFPVMLSTAAGIRTIDPQLAARRAQHGREPAAAASPRVIIPASIPTVLTGLRARRRADHHRRGGLGDARPRRPASAIW